MRTPASARRAADLAANLATNLAAFLTVWMAVPLFLGCSGEDGGTTAASDRITLEERRADGDGWAPAVAARLVEAVGYRDGAQTRARFTLADSLGRRLEVDLLVEVNPLPVLLDGSWRDAGSAEGQRGGVRAGDLHFLGGQGGRPSLGGRLSLLDTADGEVIRLLLPPLPLDPRRPGSLGPIGP